LKDPERVALNELVNVRLPNALPVNLRFVPWSRHLIVLRSRSAHFTVGRNVLRRGGIPPEKAIKTANYSIPRSKLARRSSERVE
jgi:hypothetical protein